MEPKIIEHNLSNRSMRVIEESVEGLCMAVVLGLSILGICVVIGLVLHALFS